MQQLTGAADWVTSGYPNQSARRPCCVVRPFSRAPNTKRTRRTTTVTQPRRPGHIVVRSRKAARAGGRSGFGLAHTSGPQDHGVMAQPGASWFRIAGRDSWTVVGFALTFAFFAGALVDSSDSNTPFVVIGLVCAVLTVLASLRARRQVTRRLEEARVMARVDFNAPGRLGLSYFANGRSFQESLFYAPGGTQDEWEVSRSLRKRALRAVGKPDIPDMGEWLENLQPGDHVEIALDPRNPSRFVIPALYQKRAFGRVQIAVATVGFALLVLWGLLQLVNEVDPSGP